jgi:mannose-1-phosphate guanylyltransferase
LNIILLSGGSGKRLWPLSNDIRSKQFIKIFKSPLGEYESMVQRMYRGILQAASESKVTIATSRSQVSAIHNHLGEAVGISVEPCRKDTFPAIALATAYLRDKQGIDADEAVVVCPVDPYVEDDYFAALQKLGNEAKCDTAALMLMGIEPTYPSEKYGYILPADRGAVASVRTFKEKPDEQTARSYIEQGALWNGGVFAYKLSYMLQKAQALLGYSSYDELYRHYADLPKISFDYAVAEKEASIAVQRFHGIWKDLGTWNTLTEAMQEPVIGEAVLNDTSTNTQVVNELDVPVICLGLHDLVVAASPEGVLVADKHQSSYLKPYVEAINQQIMMAEKSWGSFTVLEASEDSLTIKVILLPGHAMNYHAHENRDEVWVIVSGEGKAVVDGVSTRVCLGDIIRLPHGSRHLLAAITRMEAIEVQMGNNIDVHDKRKYKWPVKTL